MGLDNLHFISVYKMECPKEHSISMIVEKIYAL